jgi:glycosyltransferase involved in cell wall biosynthesis
MLTAGGMDGVPTGSRHNEGPLFSFIVPTFNRATLVHQAVRSALDWLRRENDGEIIVVDDCSTDGTPEMLECSFASEIQKGLIRLVALTNNVGAVRAKNAGARAASGYWLIFLDSDDLMIPAAALEMRREVAKFHEAPLIFFSCEDLVTREKIGAPILTATPLCLRDYLNHSDLGERLPIVRREIAAQFPYEETLNGWEGLTNARILRHFEPLIISPIIGRRYRNQGEDRLSSVAGKRARVSSLARGYFLLVWEFALYMQLSRAAYYLSKASFYYVIATLTARRY